MSGADAAVATYGRVAVFGGVYSNYLALEATLANAAARGAEAVFCLGDLGAFGPHPNRVFPLLIEHGVHVVQGNYDDSIGRGLDHCQCGYTDPRDKHFAALSYAYTYAKTDAAWRPWLRGLPPTRRIQLGGQQVLLCHGSPRRANEFLWESATSTAYLEKLCDEFEADVVVATHTGIKWQRSLGGGRLFVNAGVIGRPENDGRANVWYAMLEANGGGVRANFLPVVYDHERLAREMEQEGLPAEFVETIRTGWWTTCLEVLPQKERRRGRY